MNGMVLQIAPMKHPRGDFAAVTLKDNIYVVGGLEGFGMVHNQGEYYDPVVNVWRDLPNLAKPRFNCTVEKLEGSLFCVGGLDGLADVNSLERYDPREGKWAVVSHMCLRKPEPGRPSPVHQSTPA
jgi:kelch-like protein 12